MKGEGLGAGGARAGRGGGAANVVEPHVGHPGLADAGVPRGAALPWPPPRPVSLPPPALHLLGASSFTLRYGNRLANLYVVRKL